MNHFYTNKPQGWQPLSEEKRLGYIFSAIGMALIAYLLLSMGMYYLTNIFGMLLGGDLWFYFPPVVLQLIQSGIYIISLVVPFVALSKSSGYSAAAMLKKSEKSFSFGAACVAMCIGAAMVGNVFNDILTRLTSLIGFVPYYQPNGLGYGFWADLVIVITSTVIAALLEEFAFRGVLLKLLLPYGQGFALFSSALLFALCHGTAAQFIPALITGLALGYVVIATGTIRTAIIAHLVYNGLAMINSRMIMLLPHELSAIASAVITAIMLAVGIIGVISMCRQEDCFKLGRGSTVLAPDQMFKAAVTSIPLLVVSIVFVIKIFMSFSPSYM